MCVALQTCPMKKFVQLGGGHENGCPQLLVYEDERKSMAMSNCLCMVLGQEVEEAKGWQGEATWDRFSFKVTPELLLRDPTNRAGESEAAPLGRVEVRMNLIGYLYPYVLDM